MDFADLNVRRTTTKADAVRTLLPALELAVEGSLDVHVASAPLALLRRFCLLSDSGLAAAADETDIQRFAERRLQSMLAAAHRARWAVRTAA
ncbi:MAG: hypothetical protein NZ898_00445, partial [Myxococcota bacterium]|nr:hypothetical protein [Myxococcota bacterium]